MTAALHLLFEFRSSITTPQLMIWKMIQKGASNLEQLLEIIHTHNTHKTNTVQILTQTSPKMDGFMKKGKNDGNKPDQRWEEKRERWITDQTLESLPTKSLWIAAVYCSTWPCARAQAFDPYRGKTKTDQQVKAARNQCFYWLCFALSQTQEDKLISSGEKHSCFFIL